ncbi:hypothetical protein PoB_004644800 [Plakobranchus ocellatus]|uniref:IRS-type PTB domain-containing protein n=1 Tax=Plakobranchus ocellatus TaxID=259542 RepID=A0AAV4BK25_9GAST|nr:hypothetical protein PoB_004644800 [Plakobranchus ocellatus]
MEDDDDYIYQGEVLKLSESKKRLIGSKTDTWKPKYLIARKKGDKLVLEYHKKKPKVTKRSEKTLTDTFELTPSYKVEKLRNARGRSFVCEITATEFHIFLSADAEKDIDAMVFLLQAQIRLKDEIQKDVIVVIPEDTESQQRIGAKGSKCILHASPWGLTLALESTRSLLAQWPLKSIRYYETSGRGNFNIEAGRVAPMGEGLFQFRTQSGEDDFMYDLVDSYIINTLDRVKPTQKGTAEEIEEYMREHDSLHSLTTLRLCTPRSPAIRRVLRINWNISKDPTDGEDVSVRNSHSGRSRRSQSSQVSSSGAPAAAIHPSPSLSSRSGQSVQSSSLVINLERPGDQLDSRGNSLDSRASRSSEDSLAGRHVVTERPPPLPSRGGGGGVPRRSRRRDHSIPRKVDVVGSQDAGHLSEHDARSITSSQGNTSSPRLSISSTLSAASSTASPRRHSNPSTILHKVENSDSHIMGSLCINTSIASGSNSHNTEFYNLSSPNMKVRVSKSPVVSRNPNKVGRAEYLMSLSQSGVKSPTSPSLSTHSSILGDQGDQSWALATARPVTEDDHREALDYLDAVARASQQKYGSQQGSIDRRWGKISRQVSSSDQSSASGTDSPSAGGGNGRKISGGYVNLANSSASPSVAVSLSPPREIIHSRQRSAPEAMLDGSSELDSSFVMASPHDDQSLIPPPLAPKHSRQHSADASGRPAFLGLDPSVEIRPKSAGSKREGSSQSSDASLLSPNSEQFGLRSPAEKEAARRQLKGFSSPEEATGSAVAEWMVSASCEDLSDHMRTVIYDGSSSDFHDQGNTYDEIDSNTVGEDNNQISSSSDSRTSHNPSDKPPLPFTGLKKFQNNTDFGRDRSKSFGYINIPNEPPTNSNSSASSKPQSSAPSAHLIRKMVNARNKQETLRKSLSNPNFLNLGSKEHLFIHKSAGFPGGNNKLAPVQKQRSRSFGSLFFPAIKKALSRESLGSRGRSVTPERRSSNSRSTTPEGHRSRSFSFRRRNSEGSNSRNSSLKRRESFHGPGEMTIKGIRMTARSRSFRRVRGAKSVEVLSKSNDSDGNETSRSATDAAPNTVPNSLADSSTDNPDSIPPPLPKAREHTKSTTSASRLSSSAMSGAPESTVSTLVYTTLSFTQLPPVPHPDVPPPLPARRKSEPENCPPELPAKEPRSSTNSKISNYMNLGNRKSSNPKESADSNSPSQKSIGSDDPAVSKARKPRVSDIVARIEDSANNNCPSPKLNRERVKSSGPSASVSTHNDGVSVSKAKQVRQKMNAKDQAKTEHRISNRTKTDGPSKPSPASAKSESSEMNQTSRNSQVGQVRSSNGPKNVRVIQRGSKGDVQADSKPSSSQTSSPSTEKVITPFQPIPFKRQTNGISPVKPPLWSSSSSAGAHRGTKQTK